MDIMTAGRFPAPMSTEQPPTDRPPSLAELYAPSVLTPFGFARQALYEFLTALRLPPDSLVYLPELICRSLVGAIRAARCRPLYYPVNTALEPLLDPSARPAVIIGVNYFGFPHAEEPIREFCARTGAIWVEDNAHGLFSRTNDGRLLGTRGCVGLMSFRKTLPLGLGAGLLINNQAFSGLPLAEPATFEASATKRGTAAQLKDYVQRTFPWVGLAATLLRMIVRSIRTGSAFTHESEESEQSLTEIDLTAPIVNSRNLPGDAIGEAQRRRALYRHLLPIVARAGGKPVFDSLPPGVVPYGLPFYASRNGVKKVLPSLLTRKRFVIPWPDLPGCVDIGNPGKGHYSMIWMVPFTW